MQKYIDIVDYLDYVTLAIASKHDKTLDKAWDIAEPLRWYLFTGRASASFVKAMYEVKPYVMARLLVNGYSTGSHDDVVAAIKKKVDKYIKYA